MKTNTIKIGSIANGDKEVKDAKLGKIKALNTDLAALLARGAEVIRSGFSEVLGSHGLRIKEGGSVIALSKDKETEFSVPSEIVNAFVPVMDPETGEPIVDEKGEPITASSEFLPASGLRIPNPTDAGTRRNKGFWIGTNGAKASDSSNPEKTLALLLWETKVMIDSASSALGYVASRATAAEKTVALKVLGTRKAEAMASFLADLTGGKMEVAAYAEAVGKLEAEYARNVEAVEGGDLSVVAVDSEPETEKTEAEKVEASK